MIDYKIIFTAVVGAITFHVSCPTARAEVSEPLAQSVAQYASVLGEFKTTYEKRVWHRPLIAEEKQAIAADNTEYGGKMVFLEGEYTAREEMTKVENGRIVRTEITSEIPEEQKTLLPNVLIQTRLQDRVELFEARKIGPDRYMTRGTIVSPDKQRQSQPEPILHLATATMFGTSDEPDLLKQGRITRDDGAAFDVALSDDRGAHHLWTYRRLPNAIDQQSVRIERYRCWTVGEPERAKPYLDVAVIQWADFAGVQVPLEVEAETNVSGEGGAVITTSRVKITDVAWSQPSDEVKRQPGIAYPKGIPIIDMINNRHFVADEEGWRYDESGL